MAKRICTMCNEPKEIEDFPLRNRFTTRRQSYCKDCKSKMGKDWYATHQDYQKANARKHSTEYRQGLREYVQEYLSSHPCTGILPNGERCKESDPVVLQFHHARGKKVADVSVLIGRGSSLEKLIVEIEKCDVLCGNCQSRLTAKERGFFRR